MLQLRSLSDSSGSACSLTLSTSPQSLHRTPPVLVLRFALSIIDRVPKWAWLQVAVTSRVRRRILMTSRRAKNGSVNGKFIQRRGYELAAERYDEQHLKSLQYDIHRY